MIYSVRCKKDNISKDIKLKIAVNVELKSETDNEKKKKKRKENGNNDRIRTRIYIVGRFTKKKCKKRERGNKQEYASKNVFETGVTNVNREKKRHYIKNISKRHKRNKTTAFK